MKEASNRHHKHAGLLILCSTLLATSQHSVLSETKISQVNCGEITFAISFSHRGGLIQIDSNAAVTGEACVQVNKGENVGPLPHRWSR